MNIDYDYLFKIRRTVSLYTKRKTTNILDGFFSSAYTGRSMEFEDLKEYTYGDDVRNIDWKASTRSPRPVVRRYLMDRRQNVLFICDRGKKMMGNTSNGGSKKDLMLMTFGSLAYILGRDGADFALAFPGEHFAELSYFRAGNKHLEELIYNYADKCDTETDYGLTDTVEDVLYAVHKRMIIFLITDLEGLTGLSEGLIKRLTAKNDLFVISIDDAYLIDEAGHDNDQGWHGKLFASHNVRHRHEEIKLRQDILTNTSQICKRYKACMVKISSEAEIIDRTIAMIERYRHGYYG